MATTIYSYHPSRGLTLHVELEELRQVEEGSKIWVDIQTDSQQELLNVAAFFHLHELSVEDCLTPGHFPKLEDYGSYMFLLLRGLKPGFRYRQPSLEEHEVEALERKEERENYTHKLAIYLSKDFVISFRRQELGWLDALVRHAKTAVEGVLSKSTSALAHRIVDVLTDRFLRELSVFDRVIDEYEDYAIENPEEFEMGDVLALKRRLSTLRQIMRDQRVVVTRLANEAGLVPEKTIRRYFKDIDDHAREIINVLDKQIEEVASLRDAYFAMANVRLGDTMRILTVITTIAVPLNIVVGMYGMNFDAIPLLHDPRGFWLIVCLMVGVASLMLLYFRRKQWL